jgi:hypothetical protein
MSRTGTNGGIRRGAAAAAIGAVLVLATGVPASQATEGAPDPGDPAVPAVETQSLPVVAQLRGQAAAAREDAPGRNRDGKNENKAPSGKGKDSQPARAASPSPTAAPSAPAVPSALRPAVRATQKPTPTPAPTATASPVPTGSAPAPSAPVSGGPASDAPVSSAPAVSRPAASAPADSARASSGTAPGVAPSAPDAVPEAPRAGAPGTPASPETSAESGGMPAMPASPGSTVVGDFPVTGNDQSAADATAGVPSVPGTAPVGGQTAYVPIYSVPQTRAGWTPYTAAIPGNPVRSSATLKAQPEPKSALVWLGSGLVGVAGAAGLVFFRLRNP